MTAEPLHGGRLVARRLAAHGVRVVFTLAGGHLFSIYDGCRAEGIALVDTRHEATSAFAAEAWAKVTRTPGVCALTAGPGVTNGMSALGAAAQSHAPMLVLGGRAPAWRWGQSSLQEVDHVPFVAPLARFAATAGSSAEIPAVVDAAWSAALGPPGGPAFVDFPLDHVFSEAPDPALPPVAAPPAPPVDVAALERAAAVLARARRPVIMAGGDLYWARGEDALRALAEALRAPVFLNGLARGCLPAEHPLCFSRARGPALAQADVALILGVPLDFRLGFGAAFADDAELVLCDAFAPERPPPRPVTAQLAGDLPATLLELTAAARPAPAAWLGDVARIEAERRAAEAPDFADPRAPLHPLRIYGELAELLDRDAIVIGDGGEFVSWAGRVVERSVPGTWLDPGPFGCLGAGPGAALAAGLAHPDRQVVLLLGDGAFGFSGMEWDTLARHGIAVVGIVGNNGIWGLEKHPMELLYGYSVVADLAPETRYDRVVEALGGHGELVRTPSELRPALERAFAAGGPALVNVLCDPSVAYPRSANLA